MKMIDIKKKNADARRLTKDKRDEFIKDLYKNDKVPITIIGEVLALNKSSVFRIIKK